MLLKSITHNGQKLGQAALLVFLVVYFYAVLGFTVFYIHHEDDKCTTLLRCFTNYLTGCISGDGVGDSYKDFEVPNTVFAGLTHWALTLISQSYLLVVVVVLMSVSTGIIIDSFGQLRDEQTEAADMLENNCFISGLGRFRLDHDGPGFAKHVEMDMNPVNYVRLLVHLKRKPYKTMTDLERHIARRLTDEELDWLPQNRALSLENREGADSGLLENSVSQISRDVQGIVARLDAMETASLEAGGGLFGELELLSPTPRHRKKKTSSPQLKSTTYGEMGDEESPSRGTPLTAGRVEALLVQMQTEQAESSSRLANAMSKAFDGMQQRLKALEDRQSALEIAYLGEQ